MLTILILLEAYSKPTLLTKASVNKNCEYSIWIVPAGTEQDGDIDEVLALNGIRVLERVSQEEAEARAEDICHRFNSAGIQARKELLCND